jgi:hypothetical protein
VRAEFTREDVLNLKGRVTAEDMQVPVGSDMAFVVCVEHFEHTDADGWPIEEEFSGSPIFIAWKAAVGS